MKNQSREGDRELGDELMLCLELACLPHGVCVHPDKPTGVGFPLHASQFYVSGILCTFMYEVGLHKRGPLEF